MKKCERKRIVAVLLGIVLTGVVLVCCFYSGYNRHNESEQSMKEQYAFDLANDTFIGNQNDQEMGDYQIRFAADIESFSGLTIGKGAEGDVWKEWLQIAEDKVVIFDAENLMITGEYPHDLEFRDFINVNISAGLNGKATIEILTRGGSFKKEDADWIGRNGRLIVQADGGNTNLKNCTLSYHCDGWDKDIWLYGDSYFDMTEKDRWTTYLIENGASDILLSGRSGEGSEESLQAFRTQLQYGTPRMVFWCVGMNDGDNEDVINAAYKDCLDEVIEICKEKNIELILATIPTCPYWFNDHKNEYIKSLGYRYIDFADAVGSYDSITWNDGMLEEGEQRIHPTEKGGLALYEKAVGTVPELLEKTSKKTVG